MAIAGAAFAAIAISCALFASFESAWLAAALGLLLCTPIVAFAYVASGSDSRRATAALLDGIGRMQDGDFSTRIAAAGDSGPLEEVVALFNEMGDVLYRERQQLQQREMLLDSVIQSTPHAVVLTDEDGVIRYANRAARGLLAGGAEIEGRLLPEIQAELPRGFADALSSEQDGLFTIEREGEPLRCLLTRRTLVLNERPQTLCLIENLTRELHRQEADAWKKAIRVISHELNNTLAPVSSMTHVARVLLADRDCSGLDGVLAAIGEQTDHVKNFIDGYASFARLASPRREVVLLREFIESFRASTELEFEVVRATDQAEGIFDPRQMQRVLLNLINNAHEAGSSDVQVTLRKNALGLVIDVADRGPGMSAEVLAHALLPFYSTKPKGMGLGLALCREIVDAHGGHMHLENREGGGLRVSVSLPQEPTLSVTAG